MSVYELTQASVWRPTQTSAGVWTWCIDFAGNCESEGHQLGILGMIPSCGDVLLSLNDSGLLCKVPDLAYASYACLNFFYGKDPY